MCTTCYVTADITAELRVSSQYNASAAIEDIVDDVFDDVVNITHSIIDDLEASLKNNTLDFLQLDFDGMEWPVIDADLALDAFVGGLPDVHFAVTLDNFDFYVALTTSLTGSASYALNLFTSQTQFGIRIDSNTEIGVFVTVDLLMSANAAVTMDHGFHLAIDDGLAFVIDLFASDMSSLVFNGGAFEFLPITVDAEIELNAILRVGLHAGVGLAAPKIKGADYRAGIDTVMFADVANLTTIVTASTNGTAGTAAGIDDECNGDFAAAAIFELGVGAGVGASIVIDDLFSWGIGPTALLPVYYTTVGACAGGSPAAVSATPTATPTATAAAVRRDVIETTLSTSVTYSAVGCKSTGLANCPVSLQTTIVKSTEISTVLTVDADAADPTWPASIATTDISTKKFGDAASSMLLSASGVPTLYTPPPSPTATGANGEPTPGTPGTTTAFGHTVSNKTRNIIIGVTVGVGAPLLALIVFGFVACIKKRGTTARDSKYNPVVTEESHFVGKK